MEVKLSPRIRGKELYSGIKCGRHCHKQGQECGIERVYIPQVHDMGIAAQEQAQAIAHNDDNDHDEEDKQVFVGEKRDELRDGVIRVDTAQQLTFVYPSEGGLVLRQLHPYGVNAVCGQYAYVGHDETCVAGHGEGVDRQLTDPLLGSLPCEPERVGTHHKVEILCIVVSVSKYYAVYLLVGILYGGCYGSCTTVITPREQCCDKQYEQYPNPDHKHSSDSVSNRTVKGSVCHRRAPDKAVLAMLVACHLYAHSDPERSADSDGTP